MDRRYVIKAGIGLAYASSLALTTHASAQALPANGKIIVGFAAGGGSDITARLLAEQFKDLLPGTRFIVENRTGAAGKIAVDALKASAPDGGSLLLTPLVTPVLSQLMFRNPGYSPSKDFTPVGMVGYFDFAIAVGANHPAKTFAELVNWIKANPGKGSFGTPSAGSLPHFFGVMLGRALGTETIHVPYRGGAPMLADLMSGQIPIGIDTLPEMIELHKAGKIRVLANLGNQRDSNLPEVATTTELGYPNIKGNAWYSLWAPAGTPNATVTALNRALNTALASPTIVDKFKALSVFPAPGTPADLDRIRAADTEKWRPVVEASGFKAD